MLDVLLGAADAHLRRDLLPGRLTSIAHRIRTGEITIFVAFVLFTTGGLSLTFVHDPLSIWERATQAHPGLLVALDVLDVAGLVTVLAVLLQFGFFLALVLVAVASTAAVAGAIGRSEVSERALRFALLPVGIATAAMVVGLAAGFTLLALIVAQAPDVGTWPPIEVVIALLLLVAAALSLMALRRGLVASRG